jgi:hypothetical protein
MKKAVTFGIISIIIGLLISFIGLYLGEIIDPESPKVVFTLLSLMNTVGIALVGFGLFNIILNIKDWTEYFESRIKNIFLDASFLKTEDKNSLLSLQTKVFKALSDDDKIDRAGGFLEYFNDNLHKYISEPFREDVSSEIFLESEDNGVYMFCDKVTYTCRKSKGKIQPNINWFPDKEEILEAMSLIIKVKYPYNHADKGKEIDLTAMNPIDVSKLKGKITISLSEYETIDGLIVIIESKYKIKSCRFQYWQMAHPTKNFSMTLNCPREYEIQYKPLVINPEICQITEKEGYLNIKYDSWMLPKSGLAWQFRKIG